MIFLELMFVFFIIGLFTIGGGYAMIPMIEDQVVERGWMTFEALQNFFAIAESTPGPFAVNTATLVGFEQGSRFGLVGGILGGVLTTLSVVLPSFIIILVIAKYIQNFLNIREVKDALEGIKPIIVGLIFSVVAGLIFSNLFNEKWSFEDFDFIALGIMAFVFIIKQKYKKFSPILLIVLSGVIGFVFYYLIPMI